MSSSEAVCRGHVWSRWYPKDRRTIYRQCLRETCHVVEEREAKA